MGTGLFSVRMRRLGWLTVGVKNSRLCMRSMKRKTARVGLSLHRNCGTLSSRHKLRPVGPSWFIRTLRIVCAYLLFGVANSPSIKENLINKTSARSSHLTCALRSSNILPLTKLLYAISLLSPSLPSSTTVNTTSRSSTMSPR